MKLTAIDDLILAVVAAVDAAVDYPVFDGPPTPKNPKSDRYVVIGAEELNDQSDPTDSAAMHQEWKGLGQAAHDEELAIRCVAYGRARSVKLARAIALGVVGDVHDHLGKHPTPETYGALIDVTAVRAHNVTGGALVHVRFTISAKANHTS
jgi:hypothetical protein